MNPRLPILSLTLALACAPDAPSPAPAGVGLAPPDLDLELAAPPTLTDTGASGDGGASDGGVADTGSADTGPLDTGTPPAVSVTLPGAGHELQDLVCTADGDVTLTWTVDGDAWTGETADTVRAGDTIPMRNLRADQVWTCAADGGDPASSTIASYHHPILVQPIDAAAGDTVTIWYRGDVVDEDGLYLRVGFDGWIDFGDVTPEYGTTREGDPMYWQQVLLDDDGKAEVTLPEGITSVWTSVVEDGVPIYNSETAYWGLDNPAMGPWLTVDPEGGLVANFETTALGPARVDVTWDGGSLSLDSDGSDSVHHVRLDGVPTSTDLTYSITDAIGRTSASWTTHKLASGGWRIKVLAASDMQDCGGADQRWADVAAAMVDTAPNADLLVLPGDLTCNDSPGLWWLYFQRGRDLFAQVPTVAAVGNHDTPGRASDDDTSSWLRYFDPQGDGPGPEVMSVRYGSLRVIVLNTELPEQLELGGSQYTWLEEQLDAGTDATHTIVAFHRPAYDIGARFADEQHLFRDLTSLFDGRVDLVLMGHEHIYQRFRPLRYEARVAYSGRYGLESGEGVAYMVLPAAGNNGLFNDLITPEDDDYPLRLALASPALKPMQSRIGQWHGFAQVGIAGDNIQVITWEVGDTATTEKERFRIVP